MFNMGESDYQELCCPLEKLKLFSACVYNKQVYIR